MSEHLNDLWDELDAIDPHARVSFDPEVVMHDVLYHICKIKPSRWLDGYVGTGRSRSAAFQSALEHYKFAVRNKPAADSETDTGFEVENG